MRRNSVSIFARRICKRETWCPTEATGRGRAGNRGEAREARKKEEMPKVLPAGRLGVVSAVSVVAHEERRAEEGAAAEEEEEEFPDEVLADEEVAGPLLL